MTVDISLDSKHEDESDNNNNNGDMFETSKKVSLCLVKLANNVTYERLQRTLRQLPSLSERRVARVAFGLTEPRVLAERSSVDERAPPMPPMPLDATLNAAQRAAVRLGLTSSDVAVIHGPPGTGKTTTVVELVRQLVARRRRVLLCAPSNTAVDNLVSKLVATPITTLVVE
jgi:DNA polymerase alpha-associated DNA helicase A